MENQEDIQEKVKEEEIEEEKSKENEKEGEIEELPEEQKEQKRKELSEDDLSDLENGDSLAIKMIEKAAKKKLSKEEIEKVEDITKRILSGKYS